MTFLSTVYTPKSDTKNIYIYHTKSFQDVCDLLAYANLSQSDLSHLQTNLRYYHDSLCFRYIFWLGYVKFSLAF